jgi:hypothetical protein
LDFNKASDQKNQERNVRLDALEARIAGLEARPELEYRGSHASDQTYAAGNLVTRSGGLWLCLRSTTQTPGQSGDWKLVVKRGDA